MSTAYQPLHHKYRPQRFDQLVGGDPYAPVVREIAPGEPALGVEYEDGRAGDVFAHHAFLVTDAKRVDGLEFGV